VADRARAAAAIGPGAGIAGGVFRARAARGIDRGLVGVCVIRADGGVFCACLGFVAALAGVGGCGVTPNPTAFHKIDQEKTGMEKNLMEHCKLGNIGAAAQHNALRTRLTGCISPIDYPHIY